MKKSILFLFAFIVIATGVLFFLPESHSAPANTSFRESQKKFGKVKTAYDLKWPGIKQKLNSLGVDTSSFEIFIRGFKQEEELEVWVKSAKKTSWQLYATFPICQGSGVAGPKRCQGDGQVPEGFYDVSVFNPSSNYLLSLGVSYPNASDKIFACKGDPGGAIMIHGNCVTIGCIPITDDKIQELYVMAVEARTGGQSDIPIHLFPARMSDANLAALKKSNTDAATGAFWDNLKEGYDKFESAKILPSVTVDKQGKYIFK